MAHEAAKAAEIAAYKRVVLETEARLTAKVTMVCRDYYTKTYNQALDWARVLTDSNLRRVDQVYYLEDIREDITALPPPAALPLPPPEQSLTTQEPSQGIEIPIRAQKEKKRGGSGGSRTEKKAKEKTKNKADANPSEDALTIRDMVSKAKATKSKSKIDSKKDSHQSQT